MTRHGLCMQSSGMLSPTFHVHLQRWQFPFRDGDFVRCYHGDEVICDVAFRVVEGFLLGELAAFIHGTWAAPGILPLTESPPQPPGPPPRKPLAKTPLFDTTCPAYDPAWRAELKRKRRKR